VNALCFSLPQDLPFADGLSNALGATRGEVEVHVFPDGETRVGLGTDCFERNVILVYGGRDPNGNALPLHFAAQSAKAMGASSIGLVAPYLPYLRQDTQFNPGEAVSALAYARFLSASFDWIATIDPHLHRIRSLDDIFEIPALCISSVAAIAEWIRGNVVSPVIVGPDSESRQWVEPVARTLGVSWTTLTKTRTGDRQVTMSLPDPEIVRGRSAVIVDDIASSGKTLAEAATVLKGLGSRPVTCIVVHALLDQDAETALRDAGVARLVSTNTIAHSTNAIDVVPLLAARIRERLDATRGA
jgi:ribose-phosphate pyrophosphokinase